MKGTIIQWNMSLISLSILATCTCFAGSMGESSSWSKVATVSIGPSWADPGTTQTIYLQPDVFKTYTLNNNTSSLVSGELFLGMQRALNTLFSGQLGMAIAASSNASVQGDVWDDGDPDFNNFDYSYKINHFYVGAKGKLIMETKIQPYVTGSIGVGFNNAHDFNIAPKIFEQLPPPGFGSHSTTAFSYTVGAGLQKNLTHNWQFGIGYEFADWGKNGLASAPDQTIGSGLALNHLYTNQLQFSLSYIA